MKSFYRSAKTNREDLKAATTVLLASDAELAGLYKPRTQEMRQTFEIMLDFIQEALGDHVRGTDKHTQGFKGFEKISAARHYSWRPR